MNKQILLINDMAGYGKVALSAMIPVLSHMGININNLPTALVSNTLDYGKFDILDTTEFMKNTLRVWDELGFNFDAVSTGFIVNSEQAEIIRKYCSAKAEEGGTVFCDPIMGDDGHLYPGMGEDTVENMRKLISCADYVIPNYTEAALLTGKEYKEDPSEEDIREVIDALRKMGPGSVIVTSTKVDGKDQISCYDEKADQYFRVPYENIPVRFPGTGDIFSSVMIGGVLNGNSLKESVERAARVVYRMIEKSIDNEDKFKGIEIESCLEEID